jgi:hypothetical protein
MVERPQESTIYHLRGLLARPSNNNQRLQEFSKLFLGLMTSAGRMPPPQVPLETHEKDGHVGFLTGTPQALCAMARVRISEFFESALGTVCVSQHFLEIAGAGVLKRRGLAIDCKILIRFSIVLFVQ